MGRGVGPFSPALLGRTALGLFGRSLHNGCHELVRLHSDLIVISKKLRLSLLLTALLALGMCRRASLWAQSAAPAASPGRFFVLSYPLPLYKDMAAFKGIDLRELTGAPLDSEDALAMAPLVYHLHRIYGSVELPESANERNQRIQDAYEAAAGDFDLWMTVAVHRAAQLYGNAVRALEGDGERSSVGNAILELNSVAGAKAPAQYAYGAYMNPRALEAVFERVNQYRWSLLQIAMEKFGEEEAAKLLHPMDAVQTMDEPMGIFVPLGTEPDRTPSVQTQQRSVERVPPDRAVAALGRTNAARALVRPQGASAARLRRFNARFHRRVPGSQIKK